MSVTRHTRRRRTDQRPPLRALLTGLASLAAIAGIGGLALRTPGGLPGGDYLTLAATVPDVGNLRVHSEVRIAGTRVGQVLAAEPTADGGARLTLQLSPKLGSVPADSTVVSRSAGLLGQRYLQIIPGRSTKPVLDDGALAAATTSVTLGVPEALQTFDRETRGALGRSVRGLGTGLLGQGTSVNAALDVAPNAADEFQTVIDAALRPPGAAARLVPSLNAAAGAVDDAKLDIVGALRPATVALTPLVDRRAPVQQTLGQAPGTLTSAREAFDATRPLVAATRSLAGAARRALPPAPEALRRTTALLRDSRQSLQATAPLLTRARTAVPAALKITRALQPVLTPLRQPLHDLSEPVRILGEHGCDIANFGQVWRSFMGFGTVGGSQIGPLGEIRATALVTQPFAGAGDAIRLPDSLVDRDTYPAPCKMGPSVYSLVDPTG